MPSRYSSKYKKADTDLWRGEIAIILAEAQEALTIDDIKNKSMLLTDITSQKMARMLNDLIEMGMVRKAKSKQRNRMVYKSLAVMKEQGYDTI